MGTKETLLTDGAAFWARVEVVGRRTYHGLVTIESIGGAAFFRVDVPDKPEENREAVGYYSDTGGTRQYGRYRITEAPVAGQTILIGPGSIYQITPMDEASAKRLHFSSVTAEVVKAERIAEVLIEPSYDQPPVAVSDDDDSPF